jgi:K319-like protein/FG-GAP repeat protein
MASQGWFPTAARNCSLLVITVLTGCGGGGDSGGGGAAGPAPTAQATADQTVPVGTPTTLDGSASESPTGTPLSYQWTLTAKPSGSTASLSTPNSVRATFTPDVAGTYTGTLVVRANGVDSAPDAVSVNAVTGNVAPVANAGPDRNAAPSRPITLDGTASHDPNNSTVTYSWRIVEQPPNSHPTLTNATSATPTFTADVAGRYVLALTCSDGSMTSIIDQVVIIVATGNLPPVANAGPDQTVTAGQQVTLDGTRSSDPNGDTLTYSWCIKGKPEGSTATLSGANTARPTFTPDVAGSYVLCLTVNDGQAGSASDSVVVEARLPSLVNAVLQAYVKASNPGGGARVGEGNSVSFGDQFGLSVALSDNTLVVGAPHEDSCATLINGDQTNNECEGAGAVYVFTRAGATWSQQAYIKASNNNTPPGDWFGRHVALSGDTLAVTALQDNSCARGVNGVSASNNCFFGGAVYVFTRTNGVWTQQAYLKAENVDEHNGHGFGYSLALEGDTLAVGTYADASCATGINGDPNSDCLAPVGAAYVFTRTNGAWSRQAYFKPPVVLPNASYDFAYSLALSGDTLAVGSPGDPTNCLQGTSGCLSFGSAYLYRRSNGVWTQEAFIQPVQASQNTIGFGQNVALSDDTLAVMTPGGPTMAGALYVFTRADGSWSQQAQLKGSNTESFDMFGSSLALEGDTLAVGAEGEASCARGLNGNQADNSCPRAGAVYLFNRNAGVWRQQAYLKASNTDAGDAFGGMGEDNGGMTTGTVALKNGTLAIGAYRESSCASGINGNQADNNCTDAGAVYVYEGR